MKFLAVFAAILAVSCASNQWTLQMLSDATTNPHTDAALLPYLEAALNDMVTALWNGQEIHPVTITIPTTEQSSMSLNELSEALQDPNTDPALIPVLEAALNDMMEAIWAGQPVEAATVATPAMEIHYYTLSDLSAALQDPNTNSELKPYLEHALNEIMTALYAGEDMTAIVIAIPAGLTPVGTAEIEILPTPVVPAPVEPTPVIPAEVPAAPVAEAAPASPLVQIIVNINQQQEVAAPSPVVVPAPAIVADPVTVVDYAPITVDPVQVVDVAPIQVDPVQIIEPSPVVVDPIQVIEDAPAVITPVQIGTPVIGA